MILCHSMNADSVKGSHEAVLTLKPYHIPKMCLNCFSFTGGGTQKLWVQAPKIHHCGTFTTLQISILDPEENEVMH